jgi:amino acid permease-like protein
MTAHDSFADEHTYEKTLRWWDGFTISLSIPAALFVGMGYAIGLIGAWTTLVLLGLVAVLACLQNYVYSEMASMFVDKVGGISMYAHQGWRRRSTLVGPVATYGYWFSWSSSLAIYGLQIGKLVHPNGSRTRRGRSQRGWRKSACRTSSPSACWSLVGRSTCSACGRRCGSCTSPACWC